MSISIETFTTVDPNLWDKEALSLGGGFFQSHAYATYDACYPGTSPLFIRGRDVSGTLVGMAVGTVTASGRWPLSRLVRSLSLGALPITRDASISSKMEFLSALESSLAKAGVHQLECKAYDSETSAEILPGLKYQLRDRAEFYLDLSGPAESVWDGFKSERRTAIRKAIKQGLESKLETTAEAVQTLFTVQATALNRKGVKVDASEGLAKATLELIRNGAGQLWITTLNGEQMNAALLGIFGSQAYYLASGSTPQGFKLAGPAHLVWTAVQHLKENGITKLNLAGAPPAGPDPTKVDGLHRFKKDFGSRIVSQPAGIKSLGGVGAVLAKIKARISLLIVVLLSCTTSSQSETVTKLSTIFRSGQVFLTFQEVTGPTVAAYSVYRSDKPITTITSMNPIALVPSGSGTNKYTGLGFVITHLGAPLGANTGLLVLSSKAKGAFYYAVTHAGDSALIVGINSTGIGVLESVSAVGGSVQIGPATTNAEGMSVRPMYAWEDFTIWDHSKGYYGHRYNLAIAPNPSGTAVPLTLILHAAGSFGYREPETYFDRAVGIAILPRDLAFTSDQKDPYTGSERYYSGWYGYATGGLAINYTERRLMRYVQLALQDSTLNIDPNRVYARGTSMGGGGSLHLAYHYPHVFSSVSPSIGWVNPDAWSKGIWVKEFGSPEAKMPVNHLGGHAWWDWLNMEFLLENWSGKLPPAIHAFRKDDDIINESAYPKLLELTEARKQFQISRWQNGGHRSFSLDNNADFMRFRADEAFPVFSAGTASTGFEVQEGQRNQTLDWSSRHHDLLSGTDDAILDTVGRFAMTFKSLASDAEASITIRNSQRFYPWAGDTVTWSNRVHVGSALLDSGFSLTGLDGLFQVRIKILQSGNRLRLYCQPCTLKERQALIQEFIFPDINPLPLGVINHAKKTVVVTVPAGTDLTALKPKIKFLGLSISPNSESTADFSKPMQYRVSSPGSENVYSVQVLAEAVNLKKLPRKRKLADPNKIKAGSRGLPGGAGVLIGPDEQGLFYSPLGRTGPAPASLPSKTANGRNSAI